MTRFFSIVTLAAVLVTLCACQKPVQIDTRILDGAETHAGSIADHVGMTETGVREDAAAIADDATRGRAATPASALPTLESFWTRIFDRSQSLLHRADELQAIKADIQVLKTEVHAGKVQLVQAQTDLANEKQARADADVAWQKKLDKANSKWESMFRILSWLAIAAIGISIAVGVLLKDFRISIAGGAGGLAVVIACMLLGQIQRWLPWVAGGLAVVVILWIVIESLIRGSFKAAIKTNPIEDILDALGQHVDTEPEPAPQPPPTEPGPAMIGPTG